jgi:AMMECR1 domain-containing protein
VASDSNWDKETFLRQTCLKAGLKEDAWKENVTISIFSAEVFSEN